MRLLVIVTLLFLSVGVAAPCSDTEDNWSSSTQFLAPVTCGSTYCGQNTKKTWTYTCQSDVGCNTDCIDATNLIKEEWRTWWCSGDECQLGTYQVYGDGKTTRARP